MGATAGAAGQVIVEVNAANAAPAGFAVWAQLSVVVVAAACGVQLRPIAGAFAPTVAGALMVRFAPAVIANAAVLAGIVQANATLAVATPAVATVTAAVPVPPVRVTAAGRGLSVGGTGITGTASDPSTFVQVVAVAVASIHPFPPPEIVIGSAELPELNPARLVKVKLQ